MHSKFDHYHHQLLSLPMVLTLWMKLIVNVVKHISIVDLEKDSFSLLYMQE